jgi:putative ABC transport system permease protein
VLISLAEAGSDPNGGPLVVPWGQASLVVASGMALGLIATLVPAALVGRARLTALAGLRE